MPRTFNLGPHPLITVLAALGLTVGCGETMQGPQETDRMVVSANHTPGGAAACPLTPTIVVNDETGLDAAVTGASPGDVIAIDGLIELVNSHGGGNGITVATDDVTITCASAGSGLFGPSGGDFALLFVSGDRVSVNRLSLDGRQVTTAYIATGNDPIFTRNHVRCGAVCSWFQGSSGPYVAHNSYDATDAGVATFSAIQIQAGTTDAVVERNDVVGAGVTGIRLRSGINHTLELNSVAGGWASSMLVIPIGVPLTGTTVKSNQLDGAVNFGLVVGGQGFIATGNVVQNNIIKNGGQGGVSVRQACDNTFRGNNLQGNAPGVGLVFNADTGANLYTGNKGVAVDNGNFDCDGDGQPDPNVIVGT